ncbi:MAG: hypothetical protein R3C01_02200 [Planctomycetaceae bacterium]
MMNKPIAKRELGHLSVAVWANEREEQGTTFRSVSLSRRYYDRQGGEWKSTTVSLNPADVPTVVRLLQEIEGELIETAIDPK